MMHSDFTLRYQLTARPWWMQLLLAFSIFMTFVYLPWDVLIKPLGENTPTGVRVARGEHGTPRKYILLEEVHVHVSPAP